MKARVTRRAALGGAAALAVPGAARSARADARLIARCEEARALWAEYDREAAELDARGANNLPPDAPPDPEKAASEAKADRVAGMVDLVAATPAKTAAGLRAKASLVLAVVPIDRSGAPEWPDCPLFLSIVNDIQRGAAS